MISYISVYNVNDKRTNEVWVNIFHIFAGGDIIIVVYSSSSSSNHIYTCIYVLYSYNLHVQLYAICNSIIITLYYTPSCIIILTH
jgi:hypothetical protein